MHLVLLRHASRIDKISDNISHTNGQITPEIMDDDSSRWLATFDPPLHLELASDQMDNAFKKISSHISFLESPSSTPKIIIHSSPYNRCIQTTELLLSHLSKMKNSHPDLIKKSTKLRVDQGLSEWLNENFNLNYLPPNDDGYSMISNINSYLNQTGNNESPEILNDETRNVLSKVKDQTWMYNKLGHCGDYGESPLDFKKRCFLYLTSLLQYYHQKQTFEDDKDTTIFIVAHGAVISTLLQLLLNRPIFNDIPLCTPIYLKQSDTNRSVFNFMDYDFNLSSIFSIPTDKMLFKLLKTKIDVRLLDFDNVFNEFETSIDSNVTLVNQSPPPSYGRPRRNTYNIGSTADKKKDQPLRQTRSSKQLHLMNNDTQEERVIDLGKLESYFSGFSDSDSDEEEEHTSDVDLVDAKINEIVGSSGIIPSLASLNNYSKAPLTIKKTAKKHPRNTFVGKELQKFPSNLNNTYNPPEGHKNMFNLNADTSASEDEHDESSSDSSKELPLLSFSRPQLPTFTDNKAAKAVEVDSEPSLAEFQGGLIDGTFFKVPFGGETTKKKSFCQPEESNLGYNSKHNSFLESLDIMKSKSITIISTMTNETTKTRPSEHDQEDTKLQQDDIKTQTQNLNDKQSSSLPERRYTEDNSNESYLPQFYLENKKRRKSLFSDIGSTTGDSEDRRSTKEDTENANGIPDRTIDMIKSILYNQSNNSFYSSDDEANWFGGNFRQQRV